MSYPTLSERSVVLRLEFSIADAVHQRGLVPVLAAAVRAWLARPRLPPDVPAYLRADLGLDAAVAPLHWSDVRVHPPSPAALRRPPM